MNRRILFVSLLCIVATLAVASPALRQPINYRLPDGTYITITLQGDEFLDWAISSDGYTLLINEAGYYEYASQDSNNQLVLSGVRMHDISERTSDEIRFLQGVEKRLRFPREQAARLRNAGFLASELRSETALASAPTIGEVHAPVILVDFPDQPFACQKEDFVNLLSQPHYTGGGTFTGSLYDYFYDNSYGKLRYKVDVYGPYRMPNPIAYYDYKNGGDAKAMAKTAAQMAHADGCDFSKYDNDNDGTVDGIHIIFGGYGQESGAPKGHSIWSHKSSISGTSFDGKSLSVYSCSPELHGTSGANIAGIGTTAHELCHVFGIRDYYDTDDDGSGGDAVTPNRWDIMDQGQFLNGGRTPSRLSAYPKVRFGWVKEVVLNSPAQVFLPLPQEDGVVYRINTKTNNEYFLIENRLQTGWDTYVPASGMLIFHVDGSRVNNSGLNDNPANRGYYVKQAGGGANSDELDHRERDPYPYGNNNSFTDTSVPDARSKAGVNTEKPVTNIVRNADGTITFDFMGGNNSQVLIRSASNQQNAGFVQGDGYYDVGSTVTLTAVPSEKYRLGQWRNNAGSVLSDMNPYAFQATKNDTLIAEFFPADVRDNVVFDNFEYGVTNGWTIINGSQTNRWVVGDSACFSGKRGAYISNDGINYNYDVNVASISHLVHDFTVSTMIPRDALTLSFDWKCMGEFPTGGGEPSDYLEVRIVDSYTTPEAGVPFTSGDLLGKFYGSDWQHATIPLKGLSTVGSYRLVFTWVNNSGGGKQRPAAIDNVQIACVFPAELTSPTTINKAANDTQTTNITFALNYPVEYPTEWIANAPDWIVLNSFCGQVPSNTSTGACSFSCKPNTSPNTRESVIHLTVGNTPLLVKVIQEGTTAQDFSSAAATTSPPTALTAEYNATHKSVELSWTAIDETILRWDNGVNSKQPSIAPKYSTTPEVAARFLPEDLAASHGKKITSVEIYPVTVGSDMTLNIRQNNLLIHSQTLTELVPDKFNNIPLTAAVTIDSTTTLTVGYGYTHYNPIDALTIFGADAGPVQSAKNWYSYTAGYIFNEYKSSNWNIALHLNPCTVTYNVYRDGVKIASSLTDLHFEDVSPTTATDNCYTVSAVFANNSAWETAQSPPTCITITALPTPKIQDVLKVYQQDNHLTVSNLSQKKINCSLYAVSGQVLAVRQIAAHETITFDAALSRGVYILKATSPQQATWAKKILIQ
jgi:M6 family metalloprotease-like protein